MGNKKVRARGRLVAVAAVFAVAAVALAPLKGEPAEAAASDTDECGAVLTKADGSTWTCTFVEDFGGRSLDTKKWIVQDTSFSGFTMGRTCFDDEGVKVRRGELHLTVKKVKPFTCKSPFGDFTSEYKGGDISTWGRFSQTYGRFEARMRFPDATTGGVHGGFWMNPQVKTYGAWPNSGEIDVAEWWSSRHEYVHPSLHYPGENFWADTGWWCHIGDVSNHHTYAVEWDSEIMRFYYDGQLCYSRSWTPDEPLVAPQPFDHAFYLSLTNAADPAAMDGSDDPSFPASIVVDSVRVWS